MRVASFQRLRRPRLVWHRFILRCTVKLSIQDAVKRWSAVAIDDDDQIVDDSSVTSELC